MNCLHYWDPWEMGRSISLCLWQRCRRVTRASAMIEETKVDNNTLSAVLLEPWCGFMCSSTSEHWIKLLTNMTAWRHMNVYIVKCVMYAGKNAYLSIHLFYRQRLSWILICRIEQQTISLCRPKCYAQLTSRRQVIFTTCKTILVIDGFQRHVNGYFSDLIHFNLLKRVH